MRIIYSVEHFEITSKKIARMLLEGFDVKGMIAFEEDLKRLTINEGTGEIKA